jgi:hypothetical protein
MLPDLHQSMYPNLKSRKSTPTTYIYQRYVREFTAIANGASIVLLGLPLDPS